MLASKYIKVGEVAKKVVPKGAPTAQHIANVMETSDHRNKIRATLLNQECIGQFDLAIHGMRSGVIRIVFELIGDILNQEKQIISKASLQRWLVVACQQ
ncbi:hypothetical protein EOD39_16774 [Acipenser ruthenus]|uniref:Uncharacterized protein n=1 Tax=Acipenser ruthenus TaxID=7906 RepID=A0A444V537_ACIRT|nr:hypothetical protein EOD39_16774 [Acipenser ruthenus]